MKIQSNYEGNLKNQISGSSSYHVPIDLRTTWEQSDYEHSTVRISNIK